MTNPESNSRNDPLDDEKHDDRALRDAERKMRGIGADEDSDDQDVAEGSAETEHDDSALRDAERKMRGIGADERIERRRSQ